MTEDSKAPDELDGDPAQDTDGEQTDGTAENTQQAQPSEELVSASRYKSLQAAYTRETQARRQLEDRLLASQQQDYPADPADPLAGERARLEAERKQIRDEREWDEIQRSRPPDLIAAYSTFQRNYALDPSPKGAVTAFEEGIRTLASRIEAAQQVETPARKPAAAPRVDTSRSESPDPDAIDKEIARAKAEHNPGNHLVALLQRVQGR